MFDRTTSNYLSSELYVVKLTSDLEDTEESCMREIKYSYPAVVSNGYGISPFNDIQVFVHHYNSNMADILYYIKDPNISKTAPIDICYDTSDTSSGYSTDLDFSSNLEAIRISWIYSKFII